MTATDTFQILGAPRRREILRLVWDRERAAGEVCELFGDVTFGAVSQHLKVLHGAGLVSVREEGRNRFYQARKEAVGPLRQWLEEMWGSALHELKVRAEMEEARRGPKARKKPRKKKSKRRGSR